LSSVSETFAVFAAPETLASEGRRASSPTLGVDGVTGSSLTCLSSCSTRPSAARAATRRAPPRPSSAPIATRGVGAGAPNARVDGRESASRRRSASRRSVGLDRADARVVTRLSVARSRRAVASPVVAMPAPPSARIDIAFMSFERTLTRARVVRRSVPRVRGVKHRSPPTRNDRTTLYRRRGPRSDAPVGRF
jgi:hypothetical protein